MSDSEESCSDVEDYMPLVPLDEADSLGFAQRFIEFFSLKIFIKKF